MSAAYFSVSLYFVWAAALARRKVIQVSRTRRERKGDHCEILKKGEVESACKIKGDDKLLMIISGFARNFVHRKLRTPATITKKTIT